MSDQFSRTQLIFGRNNMEKLRASRVAVFGLGGVGGYTVEALARGGIGELDIIDNDRICTTNINRQIYATQKTVGQYKVDIAEERIHDINPDAVVHKYRTFYMPDTSSHFDFTQYDYIVDAIDTVTGKIELIVQANSCNVPVISCMGAGNKVDPIMLEVADIYSTSICPLAKVMRRELKKRGIDKLKVVYSKEKPIRPRNNENSAASCTDPSVSEPDRNVKKNIPGSTSFVPPAAGLIMAGEVIKDIIGFGNY